MIAAIGGLGQPRLFFAVKCSSRFRAHELPTATVAITDSLALGSVRVESEQTGLRLRVQEPGRVLMELVRASAWPALDRQRDQRLGPVQAALGLEQASSARGQPGPDRRRDLPQEELERGLAADWSEPALVAEQLSVLVLDQQKDHSLEPEEQVPGPVAALGESERQVPRMGQPLGLVRVELLLELE
jgi:hypothetical protein